MRHVVMRALDKGAVPKIDFTLGTATVNKGGFIRVYGALNEGSLDAVHVPE